MSTSQTRCNHRAASVAFAVVVGVTVGVVAGYRGGWVDTVFMRVVDVMFAFPVLLLALAVVAVLGPGTTTTILAIGIVYTPIFARVPAAARSAFALSPSCRCRVRWARETVISLPAISFRTSRDR
jgi:ABC-type antimicrobial peptide transport system permease subunit